MAGSTLTLHCSKCQLPLVVPVSFLGRTIACHRCGSAITITATTPLPPPPPAAHSARVSPAMAETTVLPRPLPPAVAVPAPEIEIQEEPLVEEEATSSKWIAWGCLFLVLAMSFSIGIFGAIGVALWLSGNWSGDRDNALSIAARRRWEGPIAPGDMPTLHSSVWTNASTNAISYAGVSVRVAGVEITKPRFQSRGENLSTTELYLVVHLQVTNRTRPEVNYQSWYSYRFENEETATSVAATCMNEDGEFLKLFPIPGAERVERHIHSDYFIATGDSITDSLVFKFPAEERLDLDREYRLTLPAEALENQGFYRFIIPASMAKRFDDRTEFPSIEQPGNSESVP